MTYYAQWFGGHSYASPTMADVETFETVADMRAACDARYWNRDGRTPAVDETSGMTIWRADPRHAPDEWDAYPDHLMTRGPRGAWRFE